MCSISKDSGVNGDARSAKSSSSSFSSTLGIIIALVLALIWRSSVAVVVSGGIVAVIILFLASVVAFVNYYIRSMRHAAVAGPQTVSLVKKTPPSSQSLDDLDAMVCDGGLTALWKREIQDQNKAFRILLTGVTGYVGRAFLYQLLREIQIAEQSQKKKKKPLPHKVYVMARGKARKNLTAADRLQTIRDDEMFQSLTEQWNAIIVPVESGDLQDEQCGMSNETLAMLAEAKLTHVVHCAADVNFNRPLKESAAINIAPALEMQRMAKAWSTCTRFVHCSTAFVNPGNGSMEKPMREALFPLGDYDPQELYDSMRGDQVLALKAKAEFGFSNNYVLTKCVGEHLVARNNDSSRVELRIVRPAVVGPSWLLPHKGWNGDKPSTVTGVFLLWGCRVLRVAPSTNEPSPIIPVDVVAAGIIHAVVAPTAAKDDQKFPLRIRNLIWSHKSPKPFMTGTEMCRDCMNTAMIYGHFTATETALCLFLMDITQNFPFLFGPIHFIFNKCPLYLLQFVCWLVKTLGIKSILEQVPVIKLFKFQDMCVLYKPYMGRAFKFESSINVPETLDVPQYGSGFITATHGFCASMFPGSMLALDVLDILPKGRLDFWWSMTQPAMNMKNRLVGYLTGQIVRATTATSLVDYTSMEEVFQTMIELEKSLQEGKKKHAVVLALHSVSPLDPVLVKYLSFYFDTMGLDVPTVLSSFKGDLTSATLPRRLKEDAARFDRHYTVAALLSGERDDSKALKSLAPGQLETLVSSLQNVVDNVTVVPLSINYQPSPSNASLRKVLERSPTGNLSFLALLSLYWSVCIFGNNKTRGGDVHMAFGVPIPHGHENLSEQVVAELNRVKKET